MTCYIWPVYKQFSGEQKHLIRGGYIWPVMPIFELGWAIPVKKHVWKFGSDWLRLSRVIIINFQGGGEQGRHFRFFLAGARGVISDFSWGGGRDGFTSEVSLISRRVVGGGGCGTEGGVAVSPPREIFFYFELFYVFFEATWTRYLTKIRYRN